MDTSSLGESHQDTSANNRAKAASTSETPTAADGDDKAANNQIASDETTSDEAGASEEIVLGRVTQCVCFECSFQKLLDQHRAKGDGLMEFYQEFGCGSRCSICVPYIQLMLKRQKSVLPVCWSKDFVAEGINPGKISVLEEVMNLGPPKDGEDGEAAVDCD